MSYLVNRALVATSLCAATLLGSTAVQAQSPQEESSPTKYLRVSRDKDNKPETLETAVVSFAPKSGAKNVTVDLVGAIHIGDEAYFDTLNRLFQDYDVVLYEMVKPKDVTPQRGSKDRQQTPLALVQRMLPSMLDLSFQVDSVDYTPENFVHADLTPTELGEAMRKRGETRMSLFIKVVKEVMQQYQEEWATGGSLSGNVSDAEILSFLTRKEGAQQLKAMIAGKLEELGPDMGLGATLDSILIVDRNEAALKVLKEQLANRKNGKPLRIAIYYGAAHMSDMASRLTKDFQMQQGDISWVQAWDITRASKRSALEGLLQLLQQPQ
ncbi:hypothetical protein CA54_23080 [Symmachiella macrocystis]|uniref:TraB family protein n=1 Tax=Symmachiella macrocystis TaxID=2527985 RepID=A0A5C6BMV3_9PLAN|nr:TraB/GumN family protein [Symmachiella macrocystis]TWU13473.1 hypothetical protein CA54_23080 [Symmachiella macrocystis]